jgi:GGDEF domain-containing protein
MGAGWIAQGADTPAATTGPDAPHDPWAPVGPDTPSVPALTRPHQDPNAHPVDNTRGLLTRTSDLLFGHEPRGPQDTDRVTTPGIIPSAWRDFRDSLQDSKPEAGSPAAMKQAGDLAASGDKSQATQAKIQALTTPESQGPRLGTMATALGHLYGADVTGVKGEYHETVGAQQTFYAQRTLAALNVLPQAINTAPGADIWAKTEAAIQNPLVKDAAKTLGMSADDFVHDYGQVSQLSPDEQAKRAESAKQTLLAGKQHTVEGQALRGTAQAERAVWSRPSDMTGEFDPMSAKGVAFNVLAGAPAMAVATAATLAGGAVGGPAGALVAGDVAMQSLFLPGQRAGLRDQIDQVVSNKLEQADEINRRAPIGQKGALNPQASALRQQAADLAASSDKIVGSASVLYAAGNALGNAPVASILGRAPGAATLIEKAVGPVLAKTFGVQTAQTMLASGIGGALQQTFQTAVDNGITHRDTTLAQAAQEIGYSFLVSAAAAAPVGAAHYAMGAPQRARDAAAQRQSEGDDLLNRARQASDAVGGVGPGAVSGQEYPGFKWNPTAPNGTGRDGNPIYGRYEPTNAQTAAASTTPRLAGPAAAPGETNPPEPATNGPSGETGATGAGAVRQAYQTKVDTLNAAAAAAEKRSDVTLEPEEEGWSVHVKGRQVATFDTVEAAREAVAGARKLVGTRPAEVSPPVTPLETGGETGSVPEVTQPPAQKAETALERTQPLEQSERRSDTGLRQRVADMDPAQLRAALLTHELTGMPNRRAYEDSEKLPVQVSADSDGLKAINDFGGHQAGDQALKAVAAAMQAEAPGRSYHLSGDEFTAQAHTEDEAHDLMARINKRLGDAVVEVTMPDGKVFHLKGLGVSYGVGKDINQADGNLQGSKIQREAQGLRSPRGVLPKGATIRSGEEGGQGHGGQVAGEPGSPKNLSSGGGTTVKVLGQSVKRPAVPTAAQAQAGNYFKPTTIWHGLPIKIETVKGQMRKGIGSNGKPFERKMSADYGYLQGTKGADEDGVDIMMGPHHDAPNAYVIDQLDHTGKSFDEHKIQIGARSESEARAQYLAHYPASWKGLGGITELSPEQLKRWLKEGDLSKPINPESVPAPAVKRGAAPDAHHDSLLQYLARHPLGLDRQEAQSQGVDPADMALSAAHVGIKRAFRSGGMSFDHAAETLHQAGYPVQDEKGHYSPNVLLDRIDQELAGNKVYSKHNEAHLPQESEHAPDWRKPLSDADLHALTPTQTQARITRLEAEAERLEREIERAGLSAPAERETEEDLDRIPFARGKPPGVQQDLFGAVINVKNEIKRLEVALEEKRNSGQESVETGRPDDLFSQARQQTDLTDKPATPPSVKTGDLSDAGEKIGGARKDKWAERGLRLSDLSTMTEGEAATLVNKKAVWNPNWQALIASGMAPKQAALAKVLFDQLAAKPRLNTPEGRRHYVEVLGRVRDMMLAAKSEIDVRGIQGKLVAELGMPTGYSIASTPEQKTARDKFWSIQKGRHSTLGVMHSDLRKADALLAKGWPAKAVKEATETEKPADESELPPKRPHLERINRIGPPVRDGNITSQDFVRGMGFRGLEFGNWAASDERQTLLNHAYEGISDLARILNLPPKALSLNGTMGLALGARGGGRFAAHYEAGKLVINMTKINGAGALAHEWGHALDHYMGELGRPDAYTTLPRGATGWRTDRRNLAHLRPELQDAWNGVMEAMYKKQQPAAEFIRDHELALEKTKSQLEQAEAALVERPSDKLLPSNIEWLKRRVQAAKEFLSELRANPKTSYSAGQSAYFKEAAGLGDYWRRPTEMFARAFEAFVQDKIAAEGNQSDYLVHGALGRGYPAEDRPAVNAAIQKLVDTLRTRSEDGKEVLFRRSTAPAKHLTVTGVRAVVHRILEGFSVKPDVVVVDTLHDLDDHPEVGHIVRDTANEDAVAFVHPRTNKIYLIADQITSPEHAASVLAHEYVVHFGLRAMLGDRRNAQYQAILEGVARAMPAELRVRGEQEFPTGFNPMNRNQRNIAAEEVLAYYGQQYAAGQSVPAQAKRWFEKLFAMIRDWWRQAWGLPKKFDELFVKRTLADLESFLRSRGSAGQDATRQGSAASATGAGPAFAGKEDTFFSGLAKAVDAAKRDKGTGAEWEATLRNMPGVKDTEIQWTGLKDWLEGRGRVTKAEVADYVAAHRVQVGEVLKGDSNQPPLTAEHIERIDNWLAQHDFGPLDDDQKSFLTEGGQGGHEALTSLHETVGLPLDEFPQGNTPGTKYQSWATPGGENYRELLMTLPPKASRLPTFEEWHAQTHIQGVPAPGTPLRRIADQQYEREKQNLMQSGNYHSSHWDEPNVLAHVRFDDRTGPNGEKILHVQEVQSDMHQAGRKYGYADEKAKEMAALADRTRAIEALGQGASPEQKQEWATAMNRRQELASTASVPSAPFRTTWPELAMKRMIRYAAEHGYDALTWDTGKTNAERYNLSKQVDRIRVWSNGEDGYHFEAAKDGRIAARDPLVGGSAKGVTAEALADNIGKELAKRAVDDLAAGREATYEGTDMDVGGSGMKAFYDKMLPATVGKLVKKWGGKVEATTFAKEEPDTRLAALRKTIEDYAAEAGLQVGPVRHAPGQIQITEPAGGFRDVPHTIMEAIGLHNTIINNQFQGDIPAHIVKITPQIRDSVMQGQPMFLKRRKGSAGTAPPAPKKGAYDLARRAVAAIPASELNLAFRRIVDPVGVSEVSRSTAIRFRESLGELAQAREEAVQSLEQFSKAFDLLGMKDRYAFIDDMEEGRPQRNPELQPAADVIRKMLDDWREKIRSLGTGALDNFIENYFPHIWSDDASAKKWLGKVFGRRPLKGPASFLKERTIPTTREGLDAGLTPISTNPLILAFAKLGEMQKFYSGVKFVQGLKDEKLAVFKPSFKPMPEGWSKIEDAVGTVRQWSEAEQGFIERGHYIMPTDGARILNNHLGGSALRNFLPAQLFRVVSNAANALQLGFSGFHLGFTTLDAIISRNAIGIERLLHGEPLRAAMAFLEAATGPGAALANIARGHRLRQAYGNMGRASPEMREIVRALMQAGGVVKMDRYFMAAQGVSPFHGVGFTTLAKDVKMALSLPQGKVAAATKVLGSFPVEYAQKLWHDLDAAWHEMPMPALTVPIEMAGRITRASTSIIMEHIVPLQKLGVFSDLASDHIRRNPLEDEASRAAAMQRIWNSVDNRLGEMVYNNLFWDRTFKDVNHMMIRAVGWNLGTVRELGGAPIDVVKLLDYMARGAPAELESPSLSKTSHARIDYERQKSKLQRIAEKVGHKIPYALALVGTTMVIGAMMQYLFTGQGPSEVKDYFFPWTGRYTKYGTKERISLPTYMKDIYEYSTQPGTTVINKANPIFGIIHAIYANEDFFGNAIRDPDAPMWRQIIQGAQYGVREVLPFSFQGTKQFAEAGTDTVRGKILASLPAVGFGPAPARVTSPEQMERYQLRETEKSYLRGLYFKLKQAQGKNDALEVGRIRDEIRDHKLLEKSTERDIRQDKVKAQEAAKKISSLIQGRSREDAATALDNAGLPAFAALWRSLPDNPRPRVAQSLGTFA